MKFETYHRTYWMRFFFLKIGIEWGTYFSKKVPNFEIVWFTPATPRVLTVKGVYVVSHSCYEQLYEPVCISTNILAICTVKSSYMRYFRRYNLCILYKILKMSPFFSPHKLLDSSIVDSGRISVLYDLILFREIVSYRDQMRSWENYFVSYMSDGWAQKRSI